MLPDCLTEGCCRERGLTPSKWGPLNDLPREVMAAPYATRLLPLSHVSVLTRGGGGDGGYTGGGGGGWRTGYSGSVNALLIMLINYLCDNLKVDFKISDLITLSDLITICNIYNSSHSSTQYMG